MSQAVDYTRRLRSHMQSVGVLSFRALSQRAGVSQRQIAHLRQGHADRLQVQQLHKLSQALELPLVELIAQFSSLTLDRASSQPEHFRQEYQRLQTQLAEQRETLRQEFQRSTLQSIESWLLQFPTAAYAAQQNPQAPAVRLLPLMRPIEQLLKEWGVEAIAAVGDEVAFDPQIHQLMEGNANPGDRVRIRYTGYRQGDRLLHRAKVSPIG